MIRAYRSEWKKTWRKGMVLGGIGIIVAFSILAVSIRFLNAHEGPTTEGQPGRGPPRFGTDELEKSDGLVLSFTGFAGNLIGIVSLVVFAQSVATEYTWGTLRVVLAREPRRGAVLAGKLVGMAAFVAVAITVAWLVQGAFAVLYAKIMGIDTTAWWTMAGARDALDGLLRVVGGSWMTGLLGAALGYLIRSPGPAIGVGIGYTLVAESLLILAWKDGAKWLPGQVLAAFNQGGNANIGFPKASILLAAYAAVLVVASWLLLSKRDVVS